MHLSEMNSQVENQQARKKTVIINYNDKHKYKIAKCGVSSGTRDHNM